MLRLGGGCGPAAKGSQLTRKSGHTVGLCAEGRPCGCTGGLNPHVLLLLLVVVQCREHGIGVKKGAEFSIVGALPEGTAVSGGQACSEIELPAVVLGAAWNMSWQLGPGVLWLDVLHIGWAAVTWCYRGQRKLLSGF
jgi:hypothetical protein